MNGKRKAARVGRPNTARAIIKNHTIILNGKRHVVKIDAELMAYAIGGVLMGLTVWGMAIAIPVLFGR